MVLTFLGGPYDGRTIESDVVTPTDTWLVPSADHPRAEDWWVGPDTIETEHMWIDLVPAVPHYRKVRRRGRRQHYRWLDTRD